MDQRLRRWLLGVGFVGGWWGAWGALGHGPAPAPLEVLTWAGEAAQGLGPQPDDAPFPDALRTSIGLALSLPDGTYRASCPTQWGDLGSAPAAATPDRRLLVVVALGEAFASTDGGCVFARLDTTGLFISGVSAQAGGVWLWGRARDALGALSGGVLLEVTADGRAVERRRWTDGFWPDDLSGWRSPDGQSQGLLVVGARSAPALWVATRGPDDALTWEAAPLPASPDLSRLSLRAVGAGDAGADGVLWLQATEGATRRLWLGLPDGDGPGPRLGAFAGGRALRWQTEALHPAAEAIHGPVWQGGAWWATFDGALGALTDATAAGAAFALGPQVPWTCLRQLGGRVTACTLEAMLHVTDMGAPDAPAPTAREVFRFDNLGAPLQGCAAPLPPDLPATCEGDWAHYGGESGFVGRPAVSVLGEDAPPPPDTDPTADADPTSDTAPPDPNPTQSPDAPPSTDATTTADASDPNGTATTDPTGCGCGVVRGAGAGGRWGWALIAFYAAALLHRRPRQEPKRDASP